MTDERRKGGLWACVSGPRLCRGGKGFCLVLLSGRVAVVHVLAIVVLFQLVGAGQASSLRPRVASRDDQARSRVVEDASLSGLRLHLREDEADQPLPPDAPVSSSSPEEESEDETSQTEGDESPKYFPGLNSTWRPLAVTSRVNPAQNFDKYRGGYDIRNSDYWASAVFTGVIGFVLAMGWFIGGLVPLVALCCSCCQGDKTIKVVSVRTKKIYFWILISTMVLLLGMSIVGSSLLFTGNKQFATRAKTIEHVILESAHDAMVKAENVTATLGEMEVILRRVNQRLAFEIRKAKTKLVTQSSKANLKLQRTRGKTHKLLHALKISQLVATSLVLFVVAAGAVAVLCKVKRLVCIMIVVGWILATLMFILFGCYTALYNITDDTCVAMNEYVHQPGNTSFDKIIPCMNLESTRRVLRQTKGAVHEFVDKVNNFIKLRNSGVAALFFPGADIPDICNPFGPAPSYTATPCEPGTARLQEIPQLLEPLKCDGDNLGSCVRKRRPITNSLYNNMTIYAEAAERIESAVPPAEELANCRFLTEMFAALVEQHCGKSKKIVRRMSYGFLIVSIALAGLTLAWLLGHRQIETCGQFSGQVAEEGKIDSTLSTADGGRDGSRERLVDDCGYANSSVTTDSPMTSGGESTPRNVGVLRTSVSSPFPTNAIRCAPCMHTRALPHYMKPILNLPPLRHKSPLNSCKSANF